MRVYSVLAIANLTLFSLIFTSGCYNETAATKQRKAPRVAYTTPPIARALDGSDQAGSGEDIFNQEDVQPSETLFSTNFLEDSDMLFESQVNFEDGLGKIGSDTRATDAVLRKAASQR